MKTMQRQRGELVPIGEVIDDLDEGRRQNAASLHAKLTRRANPVPKKASEPV